VPTVLVVTVRDQTGSAGPQVEQLYAAYANQHTLEDVLRWKPEPLLKLIEVVTQDEYTLDMVFRWGALYLVYDVT